MNTTTPLRPLEKIRLWLTEAGTEEEQEQIFKVNLSRLYQGTRIAFIFELFFLIVSGVIFRESPLTHADSYFRMGSCAILSLIIHLISRHWLNNSRVDRKRIFILLVVIFILYSFWGMLGSYAHYCRGEQMLVFETVQMLFCLFMMFYPPIAFLQVLGAFTIYYLLLYSYDGAAYIDSINYYAMGFTVFCGYVVQYRYTLANLRMNQSLVQKNLILAESSLHDPLTGLKNRLALREDFPSFIGKELLIIMSDVDSFKKINDSFGHDTGDRVLQAVAAVTREVFGEDCVYRYGGDEILIVTEKAQADSVPLLTDWEARISMLHIQNIPDDIRLHLSFGVAAGTNADMKELRAMIKKADERLYEMKHSL